MRRRVVVPPAAADRSGRRGPVVVAMAALGAGLLAFVIGMQVGQHRDENNEGSGPAAEGTLDRLDRQARQLRTLRQRQDMSFHDTLAGPVRTLKVARLAHKTKAQARDTSAPIKDGHDPDRDSAAVATQDPASSGEDSDVHGEAVAPSEPSAEFVDDDEAEDQNVSTDDTTTDHFALQVGAFPEEGAARGLAQRLKDKGYATHIASASVDGKGVWYRVRVGRYGDRSQAETARSSLSTQEGLFALVVPEG